MAVDRERIGPGFFTDAFKNTLRDYYAYGFHEAADYPDSMSTISNNWNRLNSILHDHRFWQWADSPRGRLFVTGDSRTAPMNLFQLVYLYCSFKPEEPSRYFGTIFSLSIDFSMMLVSFLNPADYLSQFATLLLSCVVVAFGVLAAVFARVFAGFRRVVVFFSAI